DTSARLRRDRVPRVREHSLLIAETDGGEISWRSPRVPQAVCKRAVQFVDDEPDSTSAERCDDRDSVTPAAGCKNTPVAAARERSASICLLPVSRATALHQD